MKKIIRKPGLLLIILLVLIMNFCTKEEVPVLITTAPTNIISNSSTSGGTIISEGTGTIIARGICWGTNIEPTIIDNKTSDGAGAGTFTSTMSGLNGSTTYFVRAYATNSAGTGYGMAMSFTTLKTPVPVCKICQQNSYNSAGILLTAGSETEYCDAALIQVESTPSVTILGVTTKWVCR